MATIDLMGVTKHFGATRVIEGVDLTIGSGEFLVILGPSGCGKSTLLRMIAGLEAVSGGTIRIDGRRVDTLPPKDRGCAMVFQNYALYPHMTVRGNLGYGLRMTGAPKAEREAAVARTAALLSLGPLLDRKPAQLSGGQRQRVAIGRALAREPAVFLFDEPLSNLDAKLRAGTRVELRKLHDRLGATSLYVTHDQVEAMTLADRIVVLNGGRVEQVGSPREIYARPSTRFVAGFVGATPMNLVPGHLDGRGGLFTGGEGLRLPLPADVDSEALGADRPVVLGVRPEHIVLGGDDALLTVEVVEDLGSHRVLHGRLGALPVAVIDHGGCGDGVSVGESLSVTLPREHLHVFDAESGKRL